MSNILDRTVYFTIGIGIGIVIGGASGFTAAALNAPTSTAIVVSVAGSIFSSLTFGAIFYRQCYLNPQPILERRPLLPEADPMT